LAAVALTTLAAYSAGTMTGVFRSERAPIIADGMAADGFVKTHDGAVYFHQSAPAGSERPVLLVMHGGPGSGSISLRDALGDELDSRFRTVFFDQRGVGRSSSVASFAIDDYLDDVERLRRALKVDRWFLFGVSWGGALAAEYALRYPEHTRGVVTWGGLIANQPTTHSMLEQMTAFYAKDGDAESANWCRSLAAQPTPFTRLQTLRIMNALNRTRLKSVVSRDDENRRVLSARDRAARHWSYQAAETGTSLWATVGTFMQARLETYDVRPRLPALSAPFLVLVGAHDPLLADAGVEQAVASMPHGELRRLPGMAHTVDRPQEVAAAVIAFVTGHLDD
jgi:proline-specific peptidase